MKSIQKVFTVILILVVCSCSNDSDINQINDKDESVDNSEISTRSSQNTTYNIPFYSQTELVVQYLPGTTPATKALLRIKHSVINHEVCQLCPDESIEKWFFDNTIGIEPRKKAIETFGDLLDIDFEFIFESELDDIIPGSGGDDTYVPLISPTNSGMTIAILDTGFDPFFSFWYDGSDPLPILYNAAFEPVGDEVSGWDFVNHNHSPFDDYPGKHGTAIGKIFLDVLTAEEIPFQILPIKVCNEFGEASYFDLVCGLHHAGAKANVVQMSLGWYDDGFGDFENTIFKNLVETYNNVVFVTSAGNGFEDGTVNDNDDLAHYPSSYDCPNLLAIAATSEAGDDAAVFSNYGEESVDFWAGGQGITFYDYAGYPLDVTLEGTSFAAPQVAALAAKYISTGAPSPEAVVDSLILHGVDVPDDIDGFSEMVFYNKLFPLLVD